MPDTLTIEPAELPIKAVHLTPDNINAEQRLVQGYISTVDVDLIGDVVLPEGMDDETFVTLFGLGSTRPRPGKEMEAIRAANFLMNADPSGAEWIRFNRPPGGEGGGRAGREGGRRRRG